jgi:hypothetical protein
VRASGTRAWTRCAARSCGSRTAGSASASSLYDLRRRPATPPRCRRRLGFGRIIASENNRGTECLSGSGIRWMSGRATRQCDRALRWTSSRNKA